MNLDAYPPTLRPVLSAAQLLDLFARWPPRPECISLLAETFEAFEDDELAGLVVDCGALAGDLEQPPKVRELAAHVAVIAEGVLARIRQ
jgi:hypothetical protein